MFSKQRAQRFRREPHTKGGGHEEGPRNDDYSTKVGSRKTDSYIIQGGPTPLAALPPPLALPLREVTRGCRQCSQGTIGGSRLQGLGGHTVGEGRLGITGMMSNPPINHSPSSILSGTRRGSGWDERREEGSRNCGGKPTGGKGLQGAVGVCDPSGSSRYEITI